MMEAPYAYFTDALLPAPHARYVGPHDGHIHGHHDAYDPAGFAAAAAPTFAGCASTTADVDVDAEDIAAYAQDLDWTASASGSHWAGSATAGDGAVVVADALGGIVAPAPMYAAETPYFAQQQALELPQAHQQLQLRQPQLHELLSHRHQQLPQLQHHQHQHHHHHQDHHHQRCDTRTGLGASEARMGLELDLDLGADAPPAPLPTPAAMAAILLSPSATHAHGNGNGRGEPAPSIGAFSDIAQASAAPPPPAGDARLLSGGRTIGGEPARLPGIDAPTLCCAGYASGAWYTGPDHDVLRGSPRCSGPATAE